MKGISLKSARVVLLTNACIISWINGLQVKISLRLIARQAWRQLRFGLIWMRLLNPSWQALRSVECCTSILQSVSSSW